MVSGAGGMETNLGDPLPLLYCVVGEMQLKTNSHKLFGVISVGQREALVLMRTQSGS